VHSVEHILDQFPHNGVKDIVYRSGALQKTRVSHTKQCSDAHVRGLRFEYLATSALIMEIAYLRQSIDGHNPECPNQKKGGNLESLTQSTM
jgi:hypothetical protein